MKFAVVTTYADRHYEEFAKRCLETMAEFWPSTIDLINLRDAGLANRSSWLPAFKRRHAHRPTSDYRMDAVRFAHKVAAIDIAAQETAADVLIWIDADCITHAPVTEAWLESLLGDADFAYLRRQMKYPECGFMLFRLNMRGRALINAIVDQYRHDLLFALPEWHDSFVIDRVREKLVSGGGLVDKSLSGNAEHTHHPLINGPLGAKLDHLKGPRKSHGHSYGRDLKVTRTEAYWQEVKAASRVLDVEKAKASARRQAAKKAARHRALAQSNGSGQ